MKDVLFVVKFSSNESETCAGVFDDFATAKAKVAELVESEADYAWVEVGGYPELRTKSQWAPKPWPVETSEDLAAMAILPPKDEDVVPFTPEQVAALDGQIARAEELLARTPKSGVLGDGGLGHHVEQLKKSRKK